VPARLSRSARLMSIIGMASKFSEGQDIAVRYRPQDTSFGTSHARGDGKRLHEWSLAKVSRWERHTLIDILECDELPPEELSGRLHAGSGRLLRHEEIQPEIEVPIVAVFIEIL